MTSTPPIRPSSAQQTHDSAGNLLPGLLCLHGGGSNSLVYKLQCRRLIWGLGQQFRFVFVEGPHESEPGFGMLPVFESCAPFYKWNTTPWTGDDLDIAPPNEVELIDSVLRKAMVENGGVDTFVGVVGFSQGARVAAGLLLRQELLERDGVECWSKLKFGVMIGGPYSPLVLGQEGYEVVPDRDYALLKELPTVTAWGKDDEFKQHIVKLADVNEGSLSRRFEFQGGHHLPLNDVDAKQLCDYVLEAWRMSNAKSLPEKE